ncbi:MAG: polymer-forming cytoskeletal protein [Peptococcaceae bacterium]|nr:polymer-forming cytoskeletal protein [Peptococcaceae bacterium]
MFGKKEAEVKPVTRIVSTNSNVTYLAEDCEVKGSFVSKGNARIDGNIEGTINVSGDLFIGQSAILKANIEAQTISIAGEVRGNVKAKDLLELSSTARLYGDINTRQLKIDQGARFIGTSSYEETSNGDNAIYASSLTDNADEKK